MPYPKKMRFDSRRHGCDCLVRPFLWRGRIEVYTEIILFAPRPPGPLFDSARMPESTRIAIGLTKRSLMVEIAWRPLFIRRVGSATAPKMPTGNAKQE